MKVRIIENGPYAVDGEIPVRDVTSIDSHDGGVSNYQKDKEYEKTVCLPNPTSQLLILDKGAYKLSCHPDGELWRWKHVAVLVKEL